MKLKLIILFQILCLTIFGQTLRINEFSNGPSGFNGEWVEILVVPTTPTIPSLKGCFYNSINVGGWILDDNNGDFSPNGLYTASGIADGFIRFKNVPPWTRLPVGALIVIYNSKSIDKDPLIPGPDIYDFNNDCVYFIPDSSSVLEYCSTTSSLSCLVKLNYSNCGGYSNFDSIGNLRNWRSVLLANSGDAIQIRDASFNLIHGVVYGKTNPTSTTAPPCNITQNLVGNSLAPYIDQNSGSNKFYAYNGTDLAGYVDANNWNAISPASSATPGDFNNPNNRIWIKDTIRKGCICDVTLNLSNNSYIIPNLPSGFKYKVYKNFVAFESDAESQINIFIYQPDGKVIKTERINIKGVKFYFLPKGFYFINLDIIYRYSHYNKTFKIINL